MKKSASSVLRAVVMQDENLCMQSPACWMKTFAYSVLLGDIPRRTTKVKKCEKAVASRIASKNMAAEFELKRPSSLRRVEWELLEVSARNPGAAVEYVKSLGEKVACIITAHHLALTVDDWASQSWYFCKPVATMPDDLAALQGIIREGWHPRFFLGSDSAPQPPNKKLNFTPQDTCAAGIYTSPILLLWWPILWNLLGH
ncbi:hypothetical protein BU17DRAFT_65785 [Hysterangium stoloniferum]|nr:hypothetical protein BU17DRAFT_65785 [Hysterangium stoloniferum]